MKAAILFAEISRILHIALKSRKYLIMNIKDKTLSLVFIMKPFLKCFLQLIKMHPLF